MQDVVIWYIEETRKKITNINSSFFLNA